jgi:hypothetical protein
MASVLACPAVGMVALWGVAHAIPTGRVVAGFEQISGDNRRIRPHAPDKGESMERILVVRPTIGFLMITAMMTSGFGLVFPRRWMTGPGVLRLSALKTRNQLYCAEE